MASDAKTSTAATATAVTTTTTTAVTTTTTTTTAEDKEWEMYKELAELSFLKKDIPMSFFVKYEEVKSNGKYFNPEEKNVDNYKYAVLCFRFEHEGEDRSTSPPSYAPHIIRWTCVRNLFVGRRSIAALWKRNAHTKVEGYWFTKDSYTKLCPAGIGELQGRLN